MKERIIYALGFFDGVHRGHQLLLRRCRSLADEYRCKAGAITFSQHPDQVVRGEKVCLINSIEDRKALLAEFGQLDAVVMLPFDREMMRLSYQDFFRHMVDTHNAGGFVCGTDFRFGHKGQGDHRLLLELCMQENLPCVVLPKLQEDRQDISSQRIRALLKEGNIQKANDLLGHPHRLSGVVEPGRHLGRTIGIPTANLPIPQELDCLRRGVYACKAYVNGKERLAVTNVGSRPTVNGQTVKAEAWILDFEWDLYGKSLRLDFYKFLRPEELFPSLEDLQSEIRKNALQTRNFFENK